MFSCRGKLDKNNIPITFRTHMLFMETRTCTNALGSSNAFTTVFSVNMIDFLLTPYIHYNPHVTTKPFPKCVLSRRARCVFSFASSLFSPLIRFRSRTFFISFSRYLNSLSATLVFAVDLLEWNENEQPVPTFFQSKHCSG